MESGDDALLERWRSGDLAAGNALFERHYASIAGFFRNKVGDAFEDLVQQTFLACVEGRDRFDGRGSFRTYMFACARNKIHDHVRQLLGPRGRVEMGVTAISDCGPSMSSIVHARSEQALLLQALRSVSIDDQIILELYYWERLTGPELAGVLGLAEGGVRSRLRRAKARLLTNMREAGQAAVATVTEDTLDEWAEELRELVLGDADRTREGP
ncbi:MAG: sigma-70 family RNA polymerase sigma factor [Myxococcales bacterium FL481]|nr:MAG: sigma-70 family RNA polymerase sigma factor [Myxococcales bacterium FL481]